MNRYKNIQEELNELKSSLKAGLNPVFSLPQGYFENFSSTVLKKIRAAEMEANAEIGAISPLLASLSRKMPLSVPDNYFKELSAAETETSEILSSIGRSMPYQVPAHYFEDLPDAIQSRVWVPKAKVVSIRKRFMQMAAAAVITGLMAISGWVYFNQDPNDDIAVSAQETPQRVAKMLKGVSNQELEEFINTTGQDAASEPVATAEKLEVKTMLTDVSDSDLDNFLAQMPEDEELAVY